MPRLDKHLAIVQRPWYTLLVHSIRYIALSLALTVQGSGCWFNPNADREFSHEGPACIPTTTQLDGLDARLPDGDKVSQAISISDLWLGKLERVNARDAKFKIKPEISGWLVDIEVEYDDGPIQYSAMEPNPNHDPELAAPCYDTLTTQVEVRVFDQQNKLDLVLPGEILRVFYGKPDGVHRSQRLQVELPRKKLRDAFELIIPKSLSAQERETVKLFLEVGLGNSASLAAHWYKDPSSKRPDESKENRERWELLYDFNNVILPKL